MADIQIDTTVNTILDALDSDDAGAGAATSVEDKVLERLDSGDTEPDQGAGETVPDTTTEAVEADKPEPERVEAPPIEAPASWKAEEKERFKALPPDLQKYLTERESERERGLSKSQQESAEARKAAEAERNAVQDERKTYASRLNVLIDIANTIDPVIAEGRKTDWAKAHTDDPLGAPGKYFTYKQREQQLGALENQRNEVLNKVRYENYQRGDTALRSKLDFWADEGKRKAFQSDFAKYLTEHEYSPEESGSIDDYRAIIIGRKAMLYDQLMTQQTKIAAAKVVPAQGKVIRTQAKDESSADGRAEALSKRAMKSGRPDDIVAAVLASI